MRRVAIIVEGQTELIFVREFLLRWFDYQIDLECRTLFTTEKLYHTDYDFPNPAADIHFQIINAGMDGNVLSRIVSREQYLYNAGYKTIIGLRDMYSLEYRQIVRNKTVDIALNERFRQGTLTSIQQKAKEPDLIRFCFAVMELEAWWIGIPSFWDAFDPTFRVHYEQYFASPESVFHPAAIVDQLFQEQNETYSKKKGEVESIVGKISRDDYVELDSSQRCPSFCEFVSYIQPL